MRRAHHGSAGVGEQHRQAVRHHDGAGKTALGGDAAVGLPAIGRFLRKLRHMYAMHLLQEDRVRIQRAGEYLAVGCDCLRLVPDMVTQVEAAVKTC